MKLLVIVAIFGCVSLTLAEEDVNGPCVRENDVVSGGAWNWTTEFKVVEKSNNNDCATKMAQHIREELKAAITYLELSAYFSSELHFRPGLAKFFLESANEERGHAKQFMEYILMRGGKFDQIQEPIISLATIPETGLSVYDALMLAFKLENAVTVGITKVAQQCEATTYDGITNDYHAVDYLTGEFLKEQHEGQRTIAGHLATLSQMTGGIKPDGHKLQELIFDKRLLKSLSKD